jgi:hypothetical protein
VFFFSPGEWGDQLVLDMIFLQRPTGSKLLQYRAGTKLKFWRSQTNIVIIAKVEEKEIDFCKI